MEELLRAVHPGARVLEVLPRTGGEIASVVEVVCADPDVRLIVKTYPSDQLWKLGKECHVYGLLPPDVPTAKLLHASREHAALVMTAIPGRPLSEVSASLAPDDLVALYSEMGRILASLHVRKMDAFGYVVNGVIEPVATNAEYMTAHFTKHLRGFRDRSSDPDLARRAEEFVTERGELWQACETPALCHNDFHEGNVLVDETPEGWRVTGIIDMENAVAADPLLDLAKADYYAPRDRRSFLDALWKGYGELPVGWSEALPIYRLHHALELWCWYASNGNTPPLDSIAKDIAEMLPA